MPEFLRGGEGLLRSAQPLLSFLAPTAYRLPQPKRVGTVSRYCKPRPLRCHPHRAFGSTIIPWQQNAAAQQLEPADPDPVHPRVRQPDPSADAKQSGLAGGNDDIASLLDSTLDMNKGTPTAPTAPTARTSHFASHSAQQANPPSYRENREAVQETGTSSGATSNARPAPSSFHDLVASLVPPPKPGRAARPMSRAAELSRAMDPRGNNSSPPPSLNPPPEVAPMKLGPTAGRTVLVNKDRGMDVGKAFRALDIQCARNSVRRDFMKQRFHERPGMKRKRLASERWRRRFKAGFQGMVKMVQKMRRQGW